VQDRNNGDKLYYHFAMSTLDLEDGEYILTLFDADDNVLAEDLLRIGDFNLDTLQYTKGENIYINVNLDATLEKKRSVINNIDTTIYPNELVDGMTDVQINAQPLYDTAKNEGYENGFTIGNQEGYTNGYTQGNQDGYVNGKADGVSEQKSKLESINITENGVYSNEDGYNHIEVNVPDLNGSYDEGKKDGIKEQKSKLKTINITENGTYSREDGYNSITVEVADLNGSYDEGYKDGYDEGVEEGASNAGGAIAETARVLDITENGVYTSKYTKEEEIVMPYELWGDDFYSHSYVKNKIYNTGIIPNKNTRLEFWWRPDDTDRLTSNYGVVIGTDYNRANNWGIIHNIQGNQSYYATIGNYQAEINFFLTDNVFYHIIMSIEDGLIINGELIGTFSDGGDKSTPLYINGVPNDVDGSEDGTYGMIKIDDIVIIPTKDGFLNTNTGELLEVVCDGDYEYTEIEKPTIEGDLYRTINVNVAPKISVVNNNMKFAYSSFTSIPEWADFKGVINMEDMFANCRQLTEIRMIDTSLVTNMLYMCNNCVSLVSVAPLDTRNVTNMYNMFASCGKLQTIPQLNTSNVTNMERMFYYCSNLTTLPQLDVSKVTNMSNYFRGGGGNLTDVGGWKNLKIDWNDNYGLVLCPKLTYQSCINILNGLYDFVGNGESTTKTLKVHSNFLTTVGDEISIGVAKGWTITA
jgi:surface protein